MGRDSEVSAFIGLGANLGEPLATLRLALQALSRLPASRLHSVSSAYRSRPLGPSGQPDYINAVAHLATALTPHALLHALHGIENDHGRVRDIRWGARTLDLDLLLYGSDEIRTADLQVPHAELQNRNFVIIPLMEIASDSRLPDGTPLATLPAAHDHHGLIRLPDVWLICD
ncbi:MAG: 2-amino-4-hydroxy-6-hydroxymethyldihydropteridine diphosphokinase [Moraxellaceae bacterium]|nr:2-amino-4-hydroxy-6-hydroxymethyldihydropteridine diphosphokinase [Moraxellaceae bacterium]